MHPTYRTKIFGLAQRLFRSKEISIDNSNDARIKAFDRCEEIIRSVSTSWDIKTAEQAIDRCLRLVEQEKMSQGFPGKFDKVLMRQLMDQHKAYRDRITNTRFLNVKS